MADKSVLTISIVTPDGEAYNQNNVKMVVLNTKSGQMGIMPNHAPVIASLEVDEVKVEYGIMKIKLPLTVVLLNFRITLLRSSLTVPRSKAILM
ncbi:MAG: Hypothetical protein AJITA_01188 [Acetilactobacillus jinshanensis]